MASALHRVLHSLIPWQLSERGSIAFSQHSQIPVPSASLWHSVDHCFCRILLSLSEHYRVLNKHTRCQVSLWRFSLFHLIPHLKISWPLFCLLWLMLTFRQVQEQVLGDSSGLTSNKSVSHTESHTNTHAHFHSQTQTCTFTCI